MNIKKQLEQRLEKLKTEHESGQNVLADLEAKKASVRDTLLRISGAIQVLEEELAKAENDENGEVSQRSQPEIEVITES